MQPLDLKKVIAEIQSVGMRAWLTQELTRAFREARKGKTGTFNEHNFDERWCENIFHLVDAILERHYRPGSSISFVVFDPKIREIFAAPFMDRVVHHFLYMMQGGWWDRRFISDSYSCRVGKGTLYGVLRAQKMMRSATKNFTEEAYILQFDISGYFMSLSRIKLYQRVKWGLKSQFGPYLHIPEARNLYKICLYLWKVVLMDDPVKKARWRGPKKNHALVPHNKTLRGQPKGYGIVIGNLTSQLASNIFLDQFDRFVKINCGYKYYGRYVDDFFIIVPKSQYKQAKKDVARFARFLREECELELHPKKRYFQPADKGMSFLGVRIYPHCLYPSNRFQAKLEKILSDLRAGKDIPNETLVSYFGYMRHLDINQYFLRLCEKYNFNPEFLFEFENPERTRTVEEILNDFKLGWDLK